MLPIRTAEVKHIVLPGFERANVRAIEGETVQGLLERSEWKFMLPTVCSFNGRPLFRKEWATTTISASDNVAFISKPYGGGGSGKASQIFGLLGVIALSALAPWAATSLFGLTSGTFGYFAVVSAITIGGGLLLSSFLSPKAATSTQEDVPQLYSLSASGNIAAPLQPIPVQYGRLKSEPKYASIPWSEYIGDDMYLNLLLCRGAGKYQTEKIYIDDTILWDSVNGLSPSFTDVQFQFCDPGEPMTLFPSNVVSAVEVDGQEISMTPVGGFALNAAGTTANAAAFDIIFPGGLFSTSDDDNELHNAERHIICELRPINNVGTPTGDWSIVVDEVFIMNTRVPKRISRKVSISPGRYEGRVYAGSNTSTDTKISNAAQWAGFRAFLEGSNVFPSSSVLAIRIKATAQLSQNSAKRFGVLQTRILPVWNGTTWVEQPSRNAFWALYDCVTNQKYGLGKSPSKIDFQAIYTQALAADARGDKFDYIFQSQVVFQAAFDLILNSARSKTAWVGDILSITRDEWKPIPQMLLTDQQTIRGSLQIDYIANDDTYSDCVVGQFLNEETWQPAQLQYPPNSDSFVGLKPAIFTMDGIVGADHVFREIGFLYRQAFLRRIKVRLDTEHDGRLLRFGSCIKIQSNLPDKWGQSGEIFAYNSTTKILTLDRELKWTPSTTHYIEMRDKRARYFGPVACQAVVGQPKQVQLNAVDLAQVEADLSMTIGDALDRMDGAEPPAFSFGIAGNLSRNVIVLNGRPNEDKVSLEMVVDSEAVHDDGSIPTPIVPTAPILQDPRVPVVAFLTAKFRQGVAEPILDASWWPAAGAIYYKAQVSYDEGTSWFSLPEISEPQLSAVVSRAALRLRVSAVGALQGPWSVVDLEAPTIRIGADTVNPDSLTQGLHDYVMSQLKQGQDAINKTLQWIASSATEHDASRSTENFAIRTAISQVNARGKAQIEEVRAILVSDQEAFAQYQLTVSALFDDAYSEVQTQATAISDLNGAFSQYQISVNASIQGLTSSVNFQATAINDLNGRLAAAVTLTLDVNHYITGFKSTNDGSFGAFVIYANLFQIAQPGVSGGAAIPVFQVLTVNGVAKLAMRGDMYADGSITANKLNVVSLSAISANIGTITAGSLLSPDGLMRILLSDTRIEIWDGT